MIWGIHDNSQEFHFLVYKCPRLTHWEFGNTTWAIATPLTGLAFISATFYLCSSWNQKNSSEIESYLHQFPA